MSPSSLPPQVDLPDLAAQMEALWQQTTQTGNKWSATLCRECSHDGHAPNPR